MVGRTPGVGGGPIDLTSLSATFAAKSGNTFATLGDSITGFNGAAGTIASPVTSAAPIQESDGYWTWASMRLMGRANYVYNGGVGGQTTTQILARVGNVIALNPKPGYCIVQGYSNDPSNGVSTATTIANLKAICDALLAAGITPILTTAVPKNITPAPPGQINRALQTYASATRGVVLCDWHPYLADPTTGQWAAGFSDDGIHPNAGAASRMGLALATVIDSLLPYSPPRLGSNADTTNLIANGMFVGSTSGLATGWSKRGANSTASKVARTDNIQGEWQQITFASPGDTGISGDIYSAWTAAATDVLQASIEFEIDATPTGVTEFGLRIADGSGANERVIVNTNATGTGIGNGTPLFPSRGVLLTPPFLAGATSGYFIPKFTATTGTIRWGRASLKKIT